MKLRVDVDGAEFLLDVRRNNGTLDYALTGASAPFVGAASIVPAGEGAYSVLLGSASYLVRLGRDGDSIAVQVAGRQYRVRISDARDRKANHLVAAAGPVELRSQMPGKVVRLLVGPGDPVEAGQGVVVVEAMKMQNEITAPKSGTVQRIVAPEGATVGAGEVLLVIA